MSLSCCYLIFAKYIFVTDFRNKLLILILKLSQEWWISKWLSFTIVGNKKNDENRNKFGNELVFSSTYIGVQKEQLLPTEKGSVLKAQWFWILSLFCATGACWVSRLTGFSTKRWFPDKALLHLIRGINTPNSAYWSRTNPECKSWTASKPLKILVLTAIGYAVNIRPVFFYHDFNGTSYLDMIEHIVYHELAYDLWLVHCALVKWELPRPIDLPRDWVEQNRSFITMFV